MRWSSLNSLLFVLLASVACDGILARPLPDTDGLYPRAPTDPPKGKKGTFLVAFQLPHRIHVFLSHPAFQRPLARPLRHQ